MSRMLNAPLYTIRFHCFFIILQIGGVSYASCAKICARLGLLCSFITKRPIIVNQAQRMSEESVRMIMISESGLLFVLALDRENHKLVSQTTYSFIVCFISHLLSNDEHQ